MIVLQKNNFSRLIVLAAVAMTACASNPPAEPVPSLTPIAQPAPAPAPVSPAPAVVPDTSTPLENRVAATNAENETIVKALAARRWQHMMRTELDLAYDYLTETSKKQHPIAVWRNGFNLGTWKHVQVDSAKCDADRCTVTVNVLMVSPRVGQINVPKIEVWLSDKTRWGYFQG